MGKSCIVALGASMAILLNASAFAAGKPASLFVPASAITSSIKAIPDGYFEPVALDTKALFAFPASSNHDVVLPHLGTLPVVHDRTRIADLGGRVTRWEGHIKGQDEMKLVFVKGISGMVTGTVDTPAGRLLLGQAGDYVIYKQSGSLSSVNNNSDVPEALLARNGDQQAGNKMRKPAEASYPIKFNAAGLANVPINGEFNISLPGAGDFRAVHDNTLAGNLGSTTFVGYLKDYGDDFRMVVTYAPGVAQGQILTPYGIYLIQTIGDQQWLIDTERSGLHHVVPANSDAAGQREASHASIMAGEPVQEKSAGSDATAVTSAASLVSDSSTTDSGKTQIDVLVMYTPGLETSYGGADQARTRIENLVALANQAYNDSDVAISLRLVAAVKIDAPDYATSLDTLNAITDGTSPYNNVAQLRRTYGADLVTVIRPFSMKQGGLCGVAWVGGANGTPIALSGAQGFSVVNDGSEGGYYCSGYTFAHELSHNMGSMHDRATVAQQNGGQGAFPYSFGYGMAGKFGTIMSYVDPQIGKFSNPNKMCGQTACGVAESNTSASANNALSLNNARLSVSAFMPEANPNQKNVAATTPSASPASSSGGGGIIDFTMLVLPALFAVRQSRRRCAAA